MADGLLRKREGISLRRLGETRNQSANQEVMRLGWYFLTSHASNSNGDILPRYIAWLRKFLGTPILTSITSRRSLIFRIRKKKKMSYTC